jgi:hypothetical protein
MKTRARRQMTGLRLPPALLERLDAWCKAQRPPVTKTGVIEMLLEDFLAGREVAAPATKSEPRARKK